MSFSRNPRNRNRNRERLIREIRYTEQCTALSSAERERKLDRLRLELEGFQRGKQYASSAVRHPDQFEDKPILDEKTYAKFKDRIKHIVRQLSAGAEGAIKELVLMDLPAINEASRHAKAHVLLLFLGQVYVKNAAQLLQCLDLSSRSFLLGFFQLHDCI